MESQSVLHISLRSAAKPTQKVQLYDVLGQNSTVDHLIEKLKDYGEHITFTYRGCVVKKDIPLQCQGIKSGSMLQGIVGARKVEVKKEYPRFTEAEVQDVVIKFRSVSTVNFHKASRPDFLEKILQAHPNLRNNLSAVAFLRDPILLASIGNPETVRRLTESHRELLEAAKLIVDTLNNRAAVPLELPHEPLDDLSDSSDSEAASSSSRRSVRRITSNQLAEALGQVLTDNNRVGGAFSANSLANISQRNQQQQEASATASSAATTSTASATPTQNRITSSMFMNALSEVLRSTRSNAEVRERTEGGAAASVATEPTPSVAPAANPTEQPALYVNELQQMNEMGLVDTESNLQALIVSNGDLEAAINIVLSGGN